MTCISHYLLAAKVVANTHAPLTHLAPPNSANRDDVYAIELPYAIRARRVISRSKTRSTFKHASWKMGRMIHVESPHEYNLAKILDFDPSVISFGEQPLVVHYQLRGESHAHYPDFVLQKTTGQKILVEVKTQDDARRPDILLRTQLLKKCLPAWGYRYELITAEWAALAPRLESIKQILKAGRAPVTLAQREHVLGAISSRGELTWDDICQAALGTNTKQIVSRMVLEGALRFDTKVPLIGTSPFAAGQVDALVLEA